MASQGKSWSEAFLEVIPQRKRHSTIPQQVTGDDGDEDSHSDDAHDGKEDKADTSGSKEHMA